MNKRCIIGSSRKKKGNSTDNYYISPPNFGTLTLPVDDKYNFNFIT